MHRVAVVGAGVIGLSVAMHLTETLGEQLEVTVIAEKFTPDTTSDKAGSIIIPIDFTPDGSLGEDEEVKRWTHDTFAHFHSLYQSGEGDKVGLCLMTGVFLREVPTPTPWWKDCVFGFRVVDPKSIEAQVLHVPPSYPTAWAFATYMMDCRRYLPWLTRKFQQNGGLIEKRKIENLGELESYDIIINCSGMGAHSLVNDTSLLPVRGQGVLVQAPWVTHFMIDVSRELTYVLPRANDILLGGTAIERDWCETLDPEMGINIRQRCEKFIPSLSRAEEIGGWSGLRPVRNKIRVEVEDSSTSPVVVHCYGHGGQGVVLHWGSTLEVGRLVREALGRLRPRAHL